MPEWSTPAAKDCAVAAIYWWAILALLTFAFNVWRWLIWRAWT